MFNSWGSLSSVMSKRSDRKKSSITGRSRASTVAEMDPRKISTLSSPGRFTDSKEDVASAKAALMKHGIGPRRLPATAPIPIGGSGAASLPIPILENGGPIIGRRQRQRTISGSSDHSTPGTTPGSMTDTPNCGSGPGRMRSKSFSPGRKCSSSPSHAEIWAQAYVNGCRWTKHASKDRNTSRKPKQMSTHSQAGETQKCTERSSQASINELGIAFGYQPCHSTTRETVANLISKVDRNNVCFYPTLHGIYLQLTFSSVLYWKWTIFFHADFMNIRSKAEWSVSCLYKHNLYKVETCLLPTIILVTVLSILNIFYFDFY